MFFNVEKILEKADCLDYADKIGMRMRSKGRYMYMECPDHIKNIGRSETDIDHCVVSEKGYHCFSCGGHGGIIDLAKKCRRKMENSTITVPGDGNLSFAEACSDICMILWGTTNGYTVNGDYHAEEQVIFPYSKEDLQLLGISPVVLIKEPITAVTKDELPFTPYKPLGYKYNFEDPFGIYYYGVGEITRYTVAEYWQENPEEFNSLILQRAVDVLIDLQMLCDRHTVAKRITDSQCRYGIQKYVVNGIKRCEEIIKTLAS